MENQDTRNAEERERELEEMLAGNYAPKDEEDETHD